MNTLSPFTTNASSEVNVLGHDSDPLGVDGAEVDVLKESRDVGFGCFLESADSSGLEARLLIHSVLTNRVVLGNLPHKPLER